MLERLSRTRRNVALGLLAAAVLWFAWVVRDVLNPLLLGYVLAWSLLPLVERLEARGRSRRAAVHWIFTIGFVLSLALLLGLAWQLRELTGELLAHVKETAAARPEGGGTAFGASLQRRLDEFTATLRGWGIAVQDRPLPELDELRAVLRDFLSAHADQAGRTGILLAGRGARLFARFLGGVASLAGLFLLVPLYTYYFLFVIGDVHRSVRRYLPARDRERLTGVFERIGQVVASFFRGRLSVALGKGLFLAVGLTLCDMPYGLLFGMLSGLLSIIPFVGAFTGFALALVVGILDHGVIGSLVRAGLVFGAGELVEGYVLVPRILGESLGLHPLVVFFALMAGGAALGMLGLLLALPLTATLVILAREFVLPALRQLADERPPA